MKAMANKAAPTEADLRMIAGLLQRSRTRFESSISGNSMEPTIPDGARIQIDAGSPRPYRTGQIVACLAGERLFAHRIVHCARNRSGELVLTRGDGWLLCDSPTPVQRIVGVVTEYWDGTRWREPGGPALRRGWRAAASLASSWLVRASIPVHLEFARRVAGCMLVAGALLKRVAPSGGR
jgi:hypothetical protein